MIGALNEKNAIFFFKIRTNMLGVKLNFKNNYDESNLQCEHCNNGSPDTQ